MIYIIYIILKYSHRLKLFEGDQEMVVLNGMGGFYVKSRPSAYKAKDAAYTVGGNAGLVLARLPAPYPITAQQKKVRDVASGCGIKKGISKAVLQKAMVDCVGPKLRK